MIKNKFFTVVLFMTLIGLAIQFPIAAEQNSIVLTLTVSDFMEDIFTDQVIAMFEAEHPGVDVYTVSVPGMSAPFGGEADVEEYLDAVEDYVSTADVVMIDSSSLDSVATRAGYFLDLAPLVNSDTTMNSADFYDAAWRSFQWDGGMWGIPTAIDAMLLFYDPAAFDAAGLAYPNDYWTMQDLEFAARMLTQFNADGSTASPGFISLGGDVGALLLSASGTTVYDPGVMPTIPRYDDPSLEAVLTLWQQMQDDGLMTIPSDESFDRANVPLQLSQAAYGGQRGFRGVNATAQATLMAALLPGGRAGMVVSGYAVSSGTQHPQEAYELVKFLSNSAEAASVVNGVKPARRTLAALSDESGARVRMTPLAPALEAVFDRAVETAIPTGEALFSEYLIDAITQMRQNGSDAATALDEVELTVRERLAAADARRQIVAVSVALPPSLVELVPGEIQLNFGLASFVSPLPNQDAWEQAAADFAATDPEVGQVILKSVSPNNTAEIAAAYDCFYMETNIVQSADLSLLLSLDPLLNSDPAFSYNDMVGNVMQQVQRNNQTWAMPLMVQPAAMRYDPEILANAGVYAPDGTWTVDQFEDALQMLRLYLGDTSIPYQPGGFDNSHWLMLIAAYGGLPIDYRTDPATLNFTETTSIEAIRNVLNLAKEGYIAYSALSGTGGNSIMQLGTTEDAVALSSEVLNSFSIAGVSGVVGRGRGRNNNAAQTPGEPNTDPLVAFPNGSQYTPISYDLAAAYISASTQYADACYRFISEVAQTPELITVMPARRSFINSYELAAAQNEKNIAFYNALDTTMQQMNTVSFPTTQIGGTRMGGSQIFETYWLNRAFDRYVLEDADLEAELAEAEVFTLGYQDCVAALPPFDPAAGNMRSYFENIAACATAIDPTAVLGL